MQGKTPAVLFVCTANVCRSPMAAGLFQALLTSHVPGGRDWLVDSAGTWASEGQRASENAIRVMQKRGIDLSNHRSKVVSNALLNLFDLILVMEPGHKEALRVEFPEIARRVWLLSELSGPPVPIEDPYGLSLEYYEKTAAEIEAYLQAGLPEILARVGHA